MLLFIQSYCNYSALCIVYQIKIGGEYRMKAMNTTEMKNTNGGRKIQCAWGNCKAKFADNAAGKAAFGRW